MGVSRAFQSTPNFTRLEDDHKLSGQLRALYARRAPTSRHYYRDVYPHIYIWNLDSHVSHETVFPLVHPVTPSIPTESP